MLIVNQFVTSNIIIIKIYIEIKTMHKFVPFKSTETIIDSTTVVTTIPHDDVDYFSAV